MKFIKKNIGNILFVIFILVFFFVPGVREFIQRQLLMKPSLETTTEKIQLKDEDYNLQLKGINVPDANLSDFKGKILFLNFWGSWCPPCRAEFPSIQALYESKKDKVNFVLIAMQDDEEKVKEFLKKNQYTTPVYIAASPISQQLSPNVFPTTFIISKDGKILKRDNGAADWNNKAVHDFINSLNQ
ncbi:MAG: TlpA family protein disulfide reductase [Cloacibacterium sp.]|nr:TlpA family protein disulfide reductase [Cloacibacterium sp.]